MSGALLWVWVAVGGVFWGFDKALFVTFCVFKTSFKSNQLMVDAAFVHVRV